jgi:CoB--CoM heterodisulfide reductase subunit C
MATYFDPEFRKMLESNPFSKDIIFCYQCGVCTGGCPSSKKTALKTRKVIHKAALGMKGVIDSDVLWYCLMCYRCTNNCRLGIDVTNVMAALRNIAAREGKAPKTFLNVGKTFVTTGWSFPVTKYTEKMRSELGLKPIKIEEKVLDEVKKITELSGFKCIVEGKE